MLFLPLLFAVALIPTPAPASAAVDKPSELAVDPAVERPLRVLRALAARERTQRFIAVATYFTAGSLYLGGAFLLRNNPALMVDNTSKGVTIEMLVFGPVELLWGAWQLIFPSGYEKMLNEIEKESAGKPSSEVTHRVLTRWKAHASSERFWLRAYGWTAVVFGAGTLGFGIWCLATQPFNQNAVGINAVLGVTSIAAGVLSAGYGTQALIAEPDAAEVLDALLDPEPAPAAAAPGVKPVLGVAPTRGGASLALSWVW